MKIVAIGLSHNEADVVQECVKDALSWVDAFVLYDSSTDGTAELARDAGAIVLPGDVNELFDNGLRQHTLAYAAALNPDWIVRIDPDEFYPRGVRFEGDDDRQDPRKVIEQVDRDGLLATRAQVIQFWITLDDVRRGLLLEDENTSVQKRRRWYTTGHTAVVAWKHDPRLAYRSDHDIGVAKNIPFYPDGQDVGAVRCAPPMLIQTHYTCRGFSQLAERIAHRRRFQSAFGKYAQNLIIDERGLHYWNGGPFSRAENHSALHRWFEESLSLYRVRGL